MEDPEGRLKHEKNKS